VPHPVPQEEAVSVAGVRPVRNAPRRRDREDLPPPEAEERPDDAQRTLETHRPDAAEPPRARPAEEAQQERFRLVVGGVPEGDRLRPRSRGAPREERVARLPRRRFERETHAPRARAHVRPPREERDAQRSARAAHEGEIAVGVAAAQAVVEVGGAKRDAERRGERVEQVQQHHRVGSARHGNQERPHAPQHPVQADEDPDALHGRRRSRGAARASSLHGPGAGVGAGTGVGVGRSSNHVSSIPVMRPFVFKGFIPGQASAP